MFRTYHKKDEITKPTPIQSIKTNHKKNFKKPKKCKPKAMEKQADETIK